MLSVVFQIHLPALSSHRVLRDLLHSFRVSAPSYQMRPPQRFCASCIPALLNLSVLLRCAPYPRRFFSCLRWLLPSVWGSSRRFYALFASLVMMPVSPMFRNSWPSLSRSLIPSLALSWSSPCRISRRA